MSTFTEEQLNILVNSALETLKKDRDKEVLKRRGGINSESQTLEQIGQDLDITRERVRQIEKAALNKLQENSSNDHEFAQATSELISKNGGIVSLESLSNNLDIENALQQHVVFLIKINPSLAFIDKNDNHNSLIVNIDSYTASQVKDLHNDLISAIKEISKPSKFDSIQKRIDGPHTSEALQELAKSSSFITELDGLWGLTTWPEVNPRSIRDKIYLVLKKTGRPMHFSDIADKISSLPANPKRVTTQAVHNELIKDKRFVLIGRGIYALAEWGYRSGTVADIIEEILKEEGAPLSKDEIIKRVLARRQVKTTTIVLNLQEKPQFKRVDKGVYALAD